jgi:hypothetical protein
MSTPPVKKTARMSTLGNQGGMFDGMAVIVLRTICSSNIHGLLTPSRRVDSASLGCPVAGVRYLTV